MDFGLDLDAMERGEACGHCWGWLDEAFLFGNLSIFIRNMFPKKVRGGGLLYCLLVLL